MFQRSRRLSLLACLTGAFIALPVMASAQQADDDDDTFEQRIIKNILGGMGVDVGRPGIDYRERSPLVIPPTAELPPPLPAGASAGPAWPREQQRNKLTVSNRPNIRATAEDPGTTSVLTPDELRRGTNPRATRVTTPTSGSIDEANVGRPMSPNQLNDTGNSIFSWRGLMGGSANEPVTFNGEPSRNALTQPPPGYQTPSAAQPYGGGVSDKGPGWKIPTILDRAEGPER